MPTDLRARELAKLLVRYSLKVKKGESVAIKGSNEAEDFITMASLYNIMGGIYWTNSRFSDAIESVEQSLEIYKTLHYHWGIANTLTNLGILHFSMEKWSQAIDYLTRANLLREEYGDDPERPNSLNNLGEVLTAMGEFSV